MYDNEIFCFLFQIEYLCTINGTNGIKDGSKIVRSVVFSTICPSVLQYYTWTGHSGFNKSGQKKDFKQKKNIFAVFFDVIHAYDKKYSKTDCEDDFKYRILKHIKIKAEKVQPQVTPSTLPNIQGTMLCTTSTIQSQETMPPIQVQETVPSTQIYQIPSNKISAVAIHPQQKFASVPHVINTVAPSTHSQYYNLYPL